MIDIVGKEQLEEFIWENTNNKKVVVIYFGADWCGPCQVLKKKIACDESKEAMPELVVGHLDIDNDQNEAASQTFGIKSLPTQIFVTLKGTQIVELKRIIGLDWTGFISTYGDIISTIQTSVNPINEQELKTNNVSLIE
jgi:thiol-disulfide isomerase/thioredoxin